MILQTLLLALLPTPSAPFEFPDDTTYSSASGEWELLVVASDPFGQGAARYTMSRGDSVAWTRRLSFTMRDVGVSDQGDVVGWGKRLSGHSILIAGLAPDGALRFVDAEHASPHILHAAVDPNPRRLVLDFENARAFFGRPDEKGAVDGFAAWLEYHTGSLEGAEVEPADPAGRGGERDGGDVEGLPTDQDGVDAPLDMAGVETQAEYDDALARAALYRRGELRPGDSFGGFPGPVDAEHWLGALAPVAGTELLVVRWRFETLREEPWLSLVDAEGHTHWKGEVAARAEGKRVHLRGDRGGGQFGVHVQGDDVWHWFQALESEDGWQVRSLEAVAIDEALVVVPRPLRARELLLEELPPLELRGEGVDRLSLYATAFLSDGRFVVADRDSGAFDVWAASGEHLMRTEAQSVVALTPFRSLGSRQLVAALPEGGLVFVAGRESAIELVEWDAAGALVRTARHDFQGGEAWLQVSRSPYDGRIWAWSNLTSDVYAFDAELNEVASMRKDAKGRWLSGVSAMVFEPNGLIRFWRGDRITNLAPSGALLGDLAVEGISARSNTQVSVGGRVLGSSHAGLRLIDIGRLAEGEVFAPVGLEESRGPIALRNGGAEIWQLDLWDRCVRRFVLPPL